MRKNSFDGGDEKITAIRELMLVVMPTLSPIAHGVMFVFLFKQNHDMQQIGGGEGPWSRPMLELDSSRFSLLPSQQEMAFTYVETFIREKGHINPINQSCHNKIFVSESASQALEFQSRKRGIVLDPKKRTQTQQQMTRSRRGSGSNGFCNVEQHAAAPFNPTSRSDKLQLLRTARRDQPEADHLRACIRYSTKPGKEEEEARLMVDYIPRGRQPHLSLLHCELRRAVLTEHVNGSSLLLGPVKDGWAHHEVSRLQLIAASELCVGSAEQRCAT
ncbi:hypothetical protein MUK42_33197 [Musa troglodytarum]|uniref:Uncharacterized protein n=1 Tax=Musa troglodytarum TaxID=320322 RepID=A0A9E7K8I8_9LILI|nr:hypothetical protein MUK42_33197 [Musa troglodytarum]